MPEKKSSAADPRAFIAHYSATASTVAASLGSRAEEIAKLADSLYEAVRAGGRIYTCGNGGSACDAMHLAEELVARYLRERPGIPAQHLIDSGTMTCWANDYDFQSVFRRQVETLMRREDALVAFSTSGNSENIIQAVQAANARGALTIVLSGKDGGKAKELAQHCFIVDSNITSHIQEAHIMIVHILCDLLETRLFPECV